jgi:hypothetical protein
MREEKRTKTIEEMFRVEAVRKLKYYVALTADGFIGHEDGSVNGFLEQRERVTDYLESF